LESNNLGVLYENFRTSTHFMFKYITSIHSLYPNVAHPQVADRGYGLQIWRVAVNTPIHNWR